MILMLFLILMILCIMKLYTIAMYEKIKELTKILKEKEDE